MQCHISVRLFDFYFTFFSQQVLLYIFYIVFFTSYFLHSNFSFTFFTLHFTSHFYIVISTLASFTLHFFTQHVLLYIFYIAIFTLHFFVHGVKSANSMRCSVTSMSDYFAFLYNFDFAILLTFITFFYFQSSLFTVQNLPLQCNALSFLYRII